MNNANMFLKEINETLLSLNRIYDLADDESYPLIKHYNFLSEEIAKEFRSLMPPKIYQHHVELFKRIRNINDQKASMYVHVLLNYNFYENNIILICSKKHKDHFQEKAREIISQYLHLLTIKIYCDQEMKWEDSSPKSNRSFLPNEGRYRHRWFDLLQGLHDLCFGYATKYFDEYMLFISSDFNLFDNDDSEIPF